MLTFDPLGQLTTIDARQLDALLRGVRVGDVDFRSMPAPSPDARGLCPRARARPAQKVVVRLDTPVPVPFRGLPLEPDDERDPCVFWLDLSRFGMARSASSSAARRMVARLQRIPTWRVSPGRSSGALTPPQRVAG